MAKKGVKFSEEHKIKIGLANKGKIRTEEVKLKISNSLTGRNFPGHSKWLIGRKASEETKRKMSESSKRLGRKPPQATKEQHQSIEWRTNISNGLKGKKLTPEHINKIIEGRKGWHPTVEMRMKARESHLRRVAQGLHNNYKGGITSENEKIRKSLEMKWWRKSCFERDNYTCAKTGQRGGDLEVHHINNFAEFPELRTSIENGITLSKESHKLFHKIYGYKNNTREQLEEFLKN